MKKKMAKKKLKKKNRKSLKEIRRAAKEHFRSLAPDYRRGNQVKRAYIQNYEYLGYTLEAILNVCIMGLDGYDQTDETRYPMKKRRTNNLPTFWNLPRI